MVDGFRFGNHSKGSEICSRACSILVFGWFCNGCETEVGPYPTLWCGVLCCGVVWCGVVCGMWKSICMQKQALKGLSNLLKIDKIMFLAKLCKSVQNNCGTEVAATTPVVWCGMWRRNILLDNMSSKPIENLEGFD